MNRVFVILLMVAVSGGLAGTDSQWIRYAAISPDAKQIVFTHRGDLYLVDSRGGKARPLTFHQAHDVSPVWRQDGGKIAFASDRFGNFDVFVIDAGGGEARRLTHHSNDEIPFCFSADAQRVIFGGNRLDASEHRQYPGKYMPEVYEVPAIGGRVTQLWTLPAEDVQVRKDGGQMVYHDIKGDEDPWRKHHVSSVTRDIWMYDVAENRHTRLTGFGGEDRNPVYSSNGRGIFYLSEESGSFNVHRLDPEHPGKTEQITRFTTHPVRFLSRSGDGTLCFTHHGDLYVKAPSGDPVRLIVEIVTEGKHNDRQMIPVQGKVRELAVSPDGKEIAYIVRGEILVSAARGKMSRRITSTPALERFVGFSPDGKALVYASERKGRWGIYQTVRADAGEPHFYAATVLREEPLLVNENDNYQPRWSPDGKEIAFIENRRSLKVLNLALAETRTLLTEETLFYMADGDQYFRWSPDGRWLLVEVSPVMGNGEIMLLAADGGKPMINLTQSGFGDQRPKWVNDGQQMLWLSDRHGLRAYANSGQRQLDVYTLFFTRAAWDRFHMGQDEYTLWKEMRKQEDEKDSANGDGKEDKKPKPLDIDREGLIERKARLTIHSSRLSDAVLSRDGETLYYLARFEKGLDLWQSEIRTRKTGMVLKLGAKTATLTWDHEMKNLYLLADGQIARIDVAKKTKTPVTLHGEITADEADERRHMFTHVCRRIGSMFYTDDCHGTDWTALQANYEPKLASIGNDREFAELLSEMLGELNVSHSGASLRHGDPQGDATASLGILIDQAHRGPGIKIKEILRNGPLDKAHISIKAGMVIQKINGETIAADTDDARYLNRLAGKFTALHLVDPDAKARLDVTVKPVSLEEERVLLYDRWVRINEADVDRLSDGRLAYVHVPGMSDGPYRQVYEKTLGKYLDREGLIVDTRFNEGGDLVGDLTMFLTGERFMTYATEDRDLGYEPNYRWNRPNVALVNEANYSDGHCFACAYKDLGIGKLIGMPVPGTCSFSSWERLWNDRIVYGAVSVSAKNKAGEWLENNQTVPDIEVKNEPGVIDRGRDQQLETAVTELMKMIGG